MGDRTNIADARQHDAEQAAGVIEQAMRNEGLIDKDVRLMGEIITEALDAAGYDVVLRADPDTSDELAAEARRLLDAYPEDVFESPPQDWKAGMVTGTVPDAVDEDGYLDVWITPDAFAAHVLRKIALPVIAALLAERDADVSAGAVARTVAMSHIAAERDAERAGRERAEAEARQLRELLHDVWLYIDWRYVTKQLTTEQKGMFADAVDEHTDGGYHAADRWWPAVAEGGEDAEDTE